MRARRCWLTATSGGGGPRRSGQLRWCDGWLRWTWRAKGRARPSASFSVSGIRWPACVAFGWRALLWGQVRERLLGVGVAVVCSTLNIVCIQYITGMAVVEVGERGKRRHRAAHRSRDAVGSCGLSSGPPLFRSLHTQNTASWSSCQHALNVDAATAQHRTTGARCPTTATPAWQTTQLLTRQHRRGYPGSLPRETHRSTNRPTSPNEIIAAPRIRRRPGGAARYRSHTDMVVSQSVSHPVWLWLPLWVLRATHTQSYDGQLADQGRQWLLQCACDDAGSGKR